MQIRYYLLDALITTEDYKQSKVINMSDIDKDKFLICYDSPFTNIAYSQYGVRDDITNVLYTKVPTSSEDQTDDMLNTKKFITDLKDVYKIVSKSKERLSGMIYYIISIDKVNQ